MNRFPSFAAILMFATMVMAVDARAEDADASPVAGPAAPSGHAPRPVSLDRVKQSIREAEAALSNVRVVSTYRTHLWSAQKRAWELGNDNEATSYFTGKPGSKARVDFHRTTQLWVGGAAPYSQEKMIVAYNGKSSMKLYAGAGTPDRPVEAKRGSITDTRHGIIRTSGGFTGGWRFSLQGFLDNHDMRLSQFMDSPGISFAAREVMHRDVACIALEAASGGLTSTWLLDPARGYAMMAYEEKLDTGVLQRRILVHELVQASPGVFYPTKASLESNNSAGLPFERGEFQASAVVVNDPAFSDDIFTIKWPRGTTVHDAVSDVVFIAGAEEAVLEKAIDEQVRLALAQPPPAPGADRPTAMTASPTAPTPGPDAPAIGSERAAATARSLSPSALAIALAIAALLVQMGRVVARRRWRNKVAA